MGRRETIGTRRATMQRAPRMRLTGKVHRVRQPRNGRIVVEGAEALAQREVNHAARSAERTYDDVLVPWFRSVQAEWPVKSGFSKDALQLHAKSAGPFLVMKLQNLAFYAGWIRQKKERVQNVVARLVWGPSQKVADTMADRLSLWLSKGD